MINKNKEINFLIKKVEECERCPLHLTRKNTVPGQGNINSPIMFVGEGPGADEDATGLPFVGKAGQFLDKMFNSWANVKREDIYICNVVKCRPPKNRVPTKDEINMCKHFLEAQILLINPKLIIPLGSTALKFFNISKKITDARGKFFEWRGIKLFPTFHPSYLIRNQSTEKGSPVWYSMLDMKAIGAIYRNLMNGKQITEIEKVITEKMKQTGGI